MKRSNLLIAAVALTIAACQPQVDRFAVSGTVTGAQGQTLYLDHMGIDAVVPVDSAKLGEDGKYSFSQPAPEGCFDIYRLRLGSKVINFAVDSVQDIEINASQADMQTAYSVSGSESSNIIKEVVGRHMQFLKDLQDVQNRYAGPQVGILSQHVGELLDVFKSDLRNGFIFSDPGSAAAYYCLFLSVNGQTVFSPQQDRQDAKTFAAVATSMDIKYPDAQRTAHLHNLALKSMAATKAPTPVSQETIDKLNSLIVESGLIEIELPDRTGVMHKLSDTKGQVVLLDFTAYKTNYSANYNLALRDLYDKFADRGFQIFQVSFDADESFWMNSSAQIPWISVHDENSLASTILNSYNVSQLPCAFIIDREGVIVQRPDELAELEASIEKLLDN